MKRGAIYFATGERYVREAENSAKSLKEHNPQLPIVLFTDMSSGPAVFDKVETVTLKHKNPFKEKGYAFGLTPFEETLFLDTDTKVVGDVSPPFALLTQYDFALAAMRWLDFDQIPARLRDFEKPHPTRPNFKFLNTGVIYYRMNDRVRSFLGHWASQIHDVRSPPGQPLLHDDQEWLNLILGEMGDEKFGVSFHLIPNTIYNCRDIFFPRLRKEGRANQVVIRHEHGLFDPAGVRYYWRVRKQLSNIYRRTRKALG